MNISSLVVDVRPAALPAVLQALRGFPGLEVHAATPQGKVVVTVECDDSAQPSDSFACVSALDGVMSVALAYHQIEIEPDLEVRDDVDPT